VLCCRYAAALCIAPLFQAFVENYNTYALEQLGVEFRNTLMAAIFRKCLTLDNSALAKNTSGKIVTLMSNDSQKLQVGPRSVHNMRSSAALRWSLFSMCAESSALKGKPVYYEGERRPLRRKSRCPTTFCMPTSQCLAVQEVTQMMHVTWGSPLIIFAVIVLLYREIEWACFVGLGVMVILVPLTGLVAKKLQALRREVVTYTDKRTSIMSEIVNGMRVIKFYAWELPFRCCTPCCTPSAQHPFAWLAMRIALPRTRSCSWSIACVRTTLLGGAEPWQTTAMAPVRCSLT
jgi:ABC-type multidrug transport system fused ATPase/permease subunit